MQISTLELEGYVNPDFSELPEIIRASGVTMGDNQSVVANLRVGEPIQLKRDYLNPFDVNAIALLTQDGRHFGWVPKEWAEVLAPFYDMGLRWEAVVHEVVGGGDLSYGVRIKLIPLFY